MRTARTALLLSPFLCLLAPACAHDPSPVDAESIAPERGSTAEQGRAAEPTPPGEDAGLVVHEWGTFTSLAGSEGVNLDGLHHASEPLPAFVHSTGPAARQSPFHVYGDRSSYIPALHVNGKMETPVLYFYSKEKRRVRVEVDFEKGLLSEWYPDVSRATPTPGTLGPGAVDVAQIERSTLAWDLSVTPFDAGAPAPVPAVDAEDPWQFAREVRAGFVQPVLPGGGVSSEAEHYVFYRGLGRLSLPLALRYCRGELKARNEGGSPVAAAFALQMGAAGGRFEALGRIDRGEQRVVTFGGEAAPRAQVVEALGREVQRALVAEGLFEDEARAMVRTWAPTWFASEGTRALYVVPRAMTDEVLPIRITPAPSSLVRVLVGRQDILTPEIEADVDRALEDRASPDAARREDAARRLSRLGRFLEPAVRRAVAWAQSDVVRKSGNEVLAQFQ